LGSEIITGLGTDNARSHKPHNVIDSIIQGAKDSSEGECTGNGETHEAREAHSRHPHSWTQPKPPLQNGYGPVKYKGRLEGLQ